MSSYKQQRKYGAEIKEVCDGLKDTVGGMAPNRNKEKNANLLNEQQKIEDTFRLRCATDFMCFTRGLNIASDKGPKMFDTCIAPYQLKVFETLSKNLEVLKKGGTPKKRRFWIERTKKAGKDSDLAVVILWLVAFSKIPLYLQVGAADKQQASIVKERIAHLLHWNEWLNDYVELVQWEVKSKKLQKNGQPLAKLHIMSSEIAGAHGGTPDLLIINELSHVNKWEFVENLMDNADGVPNGIVIIATNAGFKGTKAEIWRNNAMVSSEWSFHVWDRPAPWHTQKTVKDAKNRNSPSRFRRLWFGKWASGKGDALDEDDISRCFCLDGPLTEPEKGWVYIAGLDLGISHDHSGFVILGINAQKQKIKTVWWKRWEPPEGKDIDLIDVENVCAAMCKHFNVSFMFADPYQAKLMIQRLRKKHINTVEMSFQKPGNLTIMASSLLQVVEDGVLECYDDEDQTLQMDFGKFSIVEKSYGYKLEAVSDEFGHADVGTALVLCLPFAVDMLQGVTGLLPDDDLTIETDEEFTEEDYDEMPQEFKDTFDMYDALEDEEREFNWDEF